MAFAVIHKPKVHLKHKIMKKPLIMNVGFVGLSPTYIFFIVSPHP
jgi:hypothetical protein